ncbi:hypothetical protein [Nocardia arthritidis]|uniref:Outer membrane channel protein CpnT-like N-terminal domain-containing protein n=1 Tax=Nocardia arthritidis TaxID=228602 RepID=A0A6G9YAD0_9NOCA|nr:hypothetical protein [Nocardia arthritidis]QIS10171.1 hypothetical protein F5544_11395 [Nocardia arthritidis]
MSIEMPSELRWLAWVTGSVWPDGDEDRMFALADVWNHAAQEMRSHVSDINELRGELAAAYPDGRGREAVDQQLRLLVSGDSSIDQLADYFVAVHTSIRNTGTGIEQTKLLVLVSLAMLAIEIMEAWLFPPTAPGAEAAAIGATRAFVQRVGRRFLELIDKLKWTRVTIGDFLRYVDGNVFALAAKLSESLGKRVGELVGKVTPGLVRSLEGKVGAKWALRIGGAPAEFAEFAVKKGLNMMIWGAVQDGLVQQIQIWRGHRDGFEGREMGLTLAASIAGPFAGHLPGVWSQKIVGKLFTKGGFDPTRGWAGSVTGVVSAQFTNNFSNLAGSGVVALMNGTPYKPYGDGFAGFVGAVGSGTITGVQRGYIGSRGALPGTHEEFKAAYDRTPAENNGSQTSLQPEHVQPASSQTHHMPPQGEHTTPQSQHPTEHAQSVAGSNQQPKSFADARKEMIQQHEKELNGTVRDTVRKTYYQEHLKKLFTKELYTRDPLVDRADPRVSHAPGSAEATVLRQRTELHELTQKHLSEKTAALEQAKQNGGAARAGTAASTARQNPHSTVEASRTEQVVPQRSNSSGQQHQQLQPAEHVQQDQPSQQHQPTDQIQHQQPQQNEQIRSQHPGGSNDDIQLHPIGDEAGARNGNPRPGDNGLPQQQHQPGDLTSAEANVRDRIEKLQKQVNDAHEEVNNLYEPKKAAVEGLAGERLAKEIAVEHAQRAHDETVKSIKDKETALKTADGEQRTTLKNEIKALKETLRGQESALDKANAELKLHDIKLADEHAGLKKTVAAQDKATKEIEDAQAELTSAERDAREKYEAEVSRLGGELESARTTQQDHVRTVSRLGDELESAQRTQQDHARTVSRLGDELESAQRTQQDHVRTVSRLEGELESARTTQQDHVRTVSRLGGELESARTTQGEHARTVSRLEGELETVRTNQQQHQQTLRREWEEFRTDEQTHQEEMSKHQGDPTNEQKASQGQLEERRSRLEAKNARQTELQNEVSRLAGELESARTTQGDHARTVSRLAGELESAQRTQQEHARTVSRLQGELESAQRTQQEHARTVSRLQGELESAQRTQQEYAQTAARLQGRLETAQHAQQEHQRTVTRLRDQIEHLDQTRTTIENDIRTLRRRVTDLTNEFDSQLAASGITEAKARTELEAFVKDMRYERELIGGTSTSGRVRAKKLLLHNVIPNIFNGQAPLPDDFWINPDKYADLLVQPAKLALVGPDLSIPFSHRSDPETAS